MKSKIVLFIAVIVLFAIGCKKEEVNPEQPVQQQNQYLVEYEIDVNQNSSFNKDYVTGIVMLSDTSIMVNYFTQDSIQINFGDTVVWLSDCELFTHSSGQKFLLMKSQTFNNKYYNGTGYRISYLTSDSSLRYGSFVLNDAMSFNVVTTDQGDSRLRLNGQIVYEDTVCISQQTGYPEFRCPN